MASRCNHKYRGATKDGYRGAIINIVAHQKLDFMCAIKNIVKRQTMKRLGEK
jgi:hypothetical protein